MCSACFFLALSFWASCGGESEAERVEREWVEKSREAVANRCQEDSDCFVTGCHETMCRAVLEPDFCEHRIVVSLDDERDLSALERIVEQLLTVNEADTVRLGGYAANRWTLSFHAPRQQRVRLEAMLSELGQSGLGVLHVKSDELSRGLYDRLFDSDKDIALRTMRGAGVLFEKQIRSGDVLSKDDIRDAWFELADAIKDSFYEDEALERFWAFDVLPLGIAHLRLWPIDRRFRLPVKQWEQFSVQEEGVDWHIRGQVLPVSKSLLERWTSGGNLVVLLLGNQVLGSAIAKESISDGRFDFVIREQGENPELSMALKTLTLVSEMRGGLRIDADATANVERDLKCAKAHARQCGCIDGACTWGMDVEFNRCLYMPDK